MPDQENFEIKQFYWFRVENWIQKVYIKMLVEMMSCLSRIDLEGNFLTYVWLQGLQKNVPIL